MKKHSVSFKHLSLSFKQRVHLGTLAARLHNDENVATVPAKALESLLQAPEALALLHKTFPGRLAETLTASPVK